MGQRTTDWSALRRTAEPTPAHGLRERKKLLMRRQLSDTATEMFVERGFDSVRIAEIAEACGVSEKTVFNYFPTKESLILDQWEGTMAALRAGLAEPDASPLESVLRILGEELGALTSWLAAQDDQAEARARVIRFGALLRSSPSLRAYQHEVTERLIAAAAEILAERAGMKPQDPEPQITAAALLGLWQIQFQGLREHLAGARTPAQLNNAVTAHVRRAARLLDAGLGTPPPAPGPGPDTGP